MTKQICEISASSWFYYKGICYDARSHERKKKATASCSGYLEFYYFSPKVGYSDLRDY
jgi:hypothetical protein